MSLPVPVCGWICSGKFDLRNVVMRRLKKAQESWTAVLAVLITLTMLVWAGYSLTRFIWIWVPGESLDSLVRDAVEEVPRERDVVDLDAISRAFSFSHPATDGADREGGVEDYGRASETRLELSLRGAVFSTDPRQSRAIIASGDQQHVYRTGDQIKNTVEGVELTAVFRDHVILVNNGKEERLGIDRPLDSAKEHPAPSMESMPAGSGDVPANAAAAIPDNLISSAGTLSNIIRLQLYQQEGRIRGLQIRHGSRADLLADVGLRVGDVITAIDEVSISQVNQLSELLGRLEQQENIALQVQRMDETITVNVNRSSFGLDSQ